MKDDFSPAETCAITGASRPALRTYATMYSRWFSLSATPEFGHTRRYTAADLKVIMFIRDRTIRKNMSHENTQAALAAGELEQFDWQPPEEPAQRHTTESATESADYSSTALIPISHLQAAQALLQAEAQRREQAEAQVQALQGELQQLSSELGRAQGELAGYRSAHYRAPVWWRKLFGGAGGEA